MTDGEGNIHRNSLVVIGIEPTPVKSRREANIEEAAEKVPETRDTVVPTIPKTTAPGPAEATGELTADDGKGKGMLPAILGLGLGSLLLLFLLLFIRRRRRED